MRAQYHDHGRGLREFVQHLKPDAELHTFFPWLSSQHGYEAADHKALTAYSLARGIWHLKSAALARKR
ncbi:hypothetical protein ACVWWO_006230 [Bradyrhizobium sp. F1.13.1]